MRASITRIPNLSTDGLVMASGSTGILYTNTINNLITGVSGVTTSYANDVLTIFADETVIQSGDNVSLLVNDAGYLTTQPSGTASGVAYFGDDSALASDSNLVWNSGSAILTITGHLAATTKSFLINHPTKPNKKLQYACLEGPENGVYIRGRVTTNYIDLPDYWSSFVDSDSITVSLTAIGKPQPNLFVSYITDKRIYLSSDTEIDAHYYIMATRNDVDPLRTEI